MASHSFVQVPPDSTGKKVDNVVVDTDKYRQVTATGDPETLGAIQKVTNAASAAGDYAAVVRASSLGEQADAAVVTDTTGSISGKLRGLVKWAFERMPASLGQKAAAASLPVTLSTEDRAGLATEATLADVATETTLLGVATENTLLDVLAALVGQATEITLSAIHDILDDRLPAALGQTTMAGSFPVTIASDQPNLPEVVTNTGTMAATNDPVGIELNGHTGVGARVVASGSFAGTVILEASMDGTNFFSIQFVVVSSGGVVAGATFVAGLYLGAGTHHFSALLPAGITDVRIRLSAVSAGDVAVTLNGTSQLDFAQRSTGAYTQDPGPTQGNQIGGTAAAGGAGQFQLAQVRNVNPGVSGTAYGLVTVPWGLIDPGGSAGGYPYRLVGGRDPNTNAMRQMDLIAGPITSTGWNGLVVRPYMGSDGTNMMPTMDADARRGFMEVSRWLGSTAPTVGQKNKAASLPVTLATDQGPLSIAMSATSGGLGVLSSDDVTGGAALDGNQSADLYLFLDGLTGTLTVEASGGGVLFSTCPFVDGSGVRRMSKTYTTESSEEAWGIILPPGASQFRVRLTGHGAGSVTLEFSVSQTAQPYHNTASITASSPAAGTAGVASAAVVSANANRRGLIITNTSSGIISLAFDEAAVLYSGITLLPGASFSMDEYSFDTGEVRAIASVASCNLSVQEFS